MARNLSFKQRLFIQQYLQLNGNGTQAALRVYNVKNTATASQISYENLRKPKVQEAISSFLEADSSVLSRTVQLLENVSDHGTPHDQLKACQVVLKLYGLL